MMGWFRALALAGVLVPVAAFAQSAKDKQKASDLVKQAITKSQAGDHERAVELYLDAYRIIPQPLLLSNIGSEYQQLGKPVEALKYFCKYLDADPTGNNVPYAIAQAKVLYVELGGIETVADQDVCKPIVKPTAPEPPPPPPADRPRVPSPPPPDRPPARTSSSLRWLGVGTGVVGAGVFGLGVYYGLEANRISDDITNHDPADPWPTNINQLEADGKSYEKKQIGFMIGGGVAIAAGVALFFLGAPTAVDDTEPVAITPIATPDLLGFSAAGRF